MTPLKNTLVTLTSLLLLAGCDPGAAPPEDAGGGEDVRGAVDAGQETDAWMGLDPDAGIAQDAGAPALLPRYVEWRAAQLGEFTQDHVLVTSTGATLAFDGAPSASDASGPFSYGELTSPELGLAESFLEAIASWNVATPPDTWIEVRLRARVSGAWTGDYVLGVWASGTERFDRHSVDDQRDATGTVLTDTLRLTSSADAFQLRVRLASGTPGVTPTLWAVGLSTSDRGASRPTLTPDTSAYGRALDVPTRSQMIYPDGGEVWCSPTSTTMVLAYWATHAGLAGLTQPVPSVAAGVYDQVYDGTGNWPFNTAFAASLSGGALRAFVTRLARVEQLERLTAAGVPVITSISFADGELTGGPISSTAGHLLVVRGFDGRGDVQVNDPAGPDDAHVRFTYPRAGFDAAWAHSGRTVYVIHPLDMPLPDAGSLGMW